MAWYASLNPHHLEGESLLAEVVWHAKPDRPVDLPEGLDALARCDAMERRRVGAQLVQPDPQQAQGVCVEYVEAAASVHQHLGEPAFPMTGSTTSGYWLGLGMRFG
jgi:hypothetical protein